MAQLAALLHTTDHLFSRVVEATDLEQVRAMFSVTANDFWLYRYRFDEPSAYQPKTVGALMINNLLINLVAPTLFAYGEYHKEASFNNKAIGWLEETGAEDNRITDMYKAAGIQNKNACDSQAFVELKTGYCDLRRCLQCAVGTALFKSE